jgi:CubicO group peptidase (beta-lactamase class C family)
MYVKKLKQQKIMRNFSLLSALFFSLVIFNSCNNQNFNKKTSQATLDSIIIKNEIPAFQFEMRKGKSVISALSYNPKAIHDTIQPTEENTTKLSKNTIFQAASLSKPLFSYIVMKMVDSREIDLDKPLCEYMDIDRFVDKNAASKLTARIILAHKSGLPNWAASPSSPQWPTSPIIFKYQVDSCFAYSGEGYAFLQRAIESIRGASLEEIARKDVFEPFNMPNTSYEWLPVYDSLAINGYNDKGENRGTGRHPRANCAYTLRTNAHEYSNFLQEAILKGTGLSPETHKLMLSPASHAIKYADNHRKCDSLIYWVLGLGSQCSINAETNELTPQIYWHWGDNGSFKGLFIVDPIEKITMVYFTNSAHGHDIINSITNLYFNKSYIIYNWIED